MITVGETYLSEEFTLEDEDGNPADATVTVTVTLPNQSTDTPTVISNETGVYAFNYATQMAGAHRFTITATGGFLAATVLELGSDSFYVEADETAGIVGLEEARTHLRLTNHDADELLYSYVLVASDLCEAYTDMTWRRTTVADEVHDGGGNAIQLRKRPVLSVSAVSEGSTTPTSTQYVLNPRTGRLYRGTSTSPSCWAYGRQSVTVSYVAGPVDGLLPWKLRHGVLECIRHLWESRRGGAGVPRQGPDTEWVPILGYSIPRRVAELWDFDARRVFVA